MVGAAWIGAVVFLNEIQIDEFKPNKSGYIYRPAWMAHSPVERWSYWILPTAKESNPCAEQTHAREHIPPQDDGPRVQLIPNGR